MRLLDNYEFLEGNKEADLVYVLNTPTLQIILDLMFSDVAELSISSFHPALAREKQYDKDYFWKLTLNNKKGK